MTAQPGFNIARETAGNFQNAFAKVKDENAIERILAESMASDDPKVLQNNIGKILSQVSPERQGMAVQYLQHTYAGLKEQKEKERMHQAEIKAGVTPGLHPTLQAQELKNKSRKEGLAQYGIVGTSPNTVEQTGQEGQIPVQQSPFSKLSDEKLIEATGAPFKEISEPAKLILDQRKEQKKFEQRAEEGQKTRDLKSNLARNKDILPLQKEAQGKIKTIGNQLRSIENNIKIAERGDVDFFSKANLSNMFKTAGYPHLAELAQSIGGKVFKTNNKEIFTGAKNIFGANVTNREAQIFDEMMMETGINKDANVLAGKTMMVPLLYEQEEAKYTLQTIKDNPEITGIDLNTKVFEHMEEFDKILAEDWRNNLNKALGSSKAERKNLPQPEGKERPSLSEIFG